MGFDLAWPCLLVACAGACAGARPDPRAAWLRDALLADNRDALAARPDAVAAKLARMAEDPFAYFRGSAELAAVDPSCGGAASLLTATGARVGDPHLENLGVVDGPGGPAIELNDFDEAGEGPLVNDLRRLAVSAYIASDMADAKRKRRARIARQVAEGYAEELRALRGDGAGVGGARPGGGSGAILSALIAGQIGKPTEPAEEEASSSERERVGEILARYPRSLAAPPAAEALAVKTIAVRRGGVGSQTRARFQVRVEGAGPGDDDDWLLEIKEARRGAAAGTVRIERAMRAAGDPSLGWADLADGSYRIRRIAPGERRLDVGEIARAVRARRWRPRDLGDLALGAGRLLARAHARAAAALPSPGAPPFDVVLAREQAFIDETTRFAVCRGEQTIADRRLLRQLLRDRGPLLGWRAASGQHELQPSRDEEVHLRRGVEWHADGQKRP